MIDCKDFNFNGFVLRGSKPISPARAQFLRERNMQVEQANGRIRVTGNLNFNADSVKDFLKHEAEMLALASKPAAPSSKAIAAYRAHLS